MKRIIILSAVVMLYACGEKPATLEHKKIELKSLKEQASELKTQINMLEKDLAVLDTTLEGGIPVRVMAVKPGVFQHFIEQPGTVTSKENVTVSSEMGGVVKAILAEEGQWVNKGDAIVQLDGSVLASQVAELRQARDLARTTFERQDNLWKKGIGSELQYLQIKNQYSSLQKKLEGAEAQLDKMELSAPISGRVDEIFFNVGELAAPGFPALRVVNTRQVQVEADVTERYSASLHTQDVVHISFKALGVEKEAPITFVGQVINPKNRTFKVKINLDNKDGVIKPNAVASLKIQDYQSDNALALPSEIVKKDMRGNFVFVAKDKHAVKTYIMTGRSYKDETEVLSGLNDNDKVITAGHNEVANGSNIDIKK